MARPRWIVVAMGFVAGGLAANVLLGPLVADVIRYRTSATTRNQILGGDAATLAIVVPVGLIALVLLWRRHPAGPVIALGPALFAAYTMPQLIVGQEYLELAGNNERFFALQLAVFVAAGAVIVGSWTSIEGDAALPPRLRRIAGWALVGVALFLVVGLHLPTLIDAWSDRPTRVEYTSTPTAFWLVKLMDLGIVVPVALATGVGLLRGSRGTARAAIAVIGGYALLATSVAGMAIVMQLRNDPDASLANIAAFTSFAGAFLALAAAMVAPSFRLGRVSAPRREPAPIDREVLDISGPTRRPRSHERSTR